MPDVFSPEQRSDIMARIRSSGMKPEIRLGRLLRELFPETEIVERPKSLPGHPDFYLPALRVAVFADGCFFHGCPKHLRMPRTNQDYWARKIERNRQRDLRVRRDLRRLGVRCVRVWEHELTENASSAKRKLRRAIKRGIRQFGQQLSLCSPSSRGKTAAA